MHTAQGSSIVSRFWGRFINLRLNFQLDLVMTTWVAKEKMLELSNKVYIKK